MISTNITLKLTWLLQILYLILLFNSEFVVKRVIHHQVYRVRNHVFLLGYALGYHRALTDI